MKGATALQLLRVRTHDLNDRIMRYNQKAESTPPKFNTWGVKETGYEEGTRTKFKKGDWAEVLLGENTRGCNSLCFRKQKILTQGRACMTWFRIKYQLEMPVEKPAQVEKTAEEKRKINNRNRMARRKRSREMNRVAEAGRDGEEDRAEEEDGETNGEEEGEADGEAI